MSKVVMTKGLPASGKSTWAREMLRKEPGKWKRINKDDLRAMLDDNKWSKKNEEYVLLLRDTIALSALDHGWSVIIDDTNLAPRHETHIREIAKEKKAEFEVKDFTDIPIETCIERDLKRPVSVGEKVIRQMYNQFLRPKVNAYVASLTAPNAIICDLDGTLALFGDKNPYDRDFENDKLNVPIADIFNVYYDKTVTSFIFSGRNEKYREVTEKWLEDKGVLYDHLKMRKDGDSRKDSIIKKELFNEHIRDKYNVVFVLDDRNQVVDLWRSMGITCLQVAEGDF